MNPQPRVYKTLALPLRYDGTRTAAVIIEMHGGFPGSHSLDNKIAIYYLAVRFYLRDDLAKLEEYAVGDLNPGLMIKSHVLFHLS